MGVTIGDIGGDLSGNVAGGDIYAEGEPGAAEMIEQFRYFSAEYGCPEEIAEEVAGEMEGCLSTGEEPSETMVAKWMEAITDFAPDVIRLAMVIVGTLTAQLA